MSKVLKTELSLSERLKAPMPSFFEKVFYAGIVLGALSAGLLAFEQEIAAAGLRVPAWLTPVTGWVGAASSLLARLTVKVDD